MRESHPGRNNRLVPETVLEFLLLRLHCHSVQARDGAAVDRRNRAPSLPQPEKFWNLRLGRCQFALGRLGW